jgi:hypothetical protein
MSVAQAINEWTRAMRCAGCTCIGSQPIRDTRNVTSAAYDIARTQCTSADDIVSKLRWAKRDCAERGVVDHVVLRLLDELIADAERLSV